MLVYKIDTKNKTLDSTPSKTNDNVLLVFATTSSALVVVCVLFSLIGCSTPSYMFYISIFHYMLVTLWSLVVRRNDLTLDTALNIALSIFKHARPPVVHRFCNTKVITMTFFKASSQSHQG